MENTGKHANRRSSRFRLVPTHPQGFAHPPWERKFTCGRVMIAPSMPELELAPWTRRNLARQIARRQNNACDRQHERTVEVAARAGGMGSGGRMGRFSQMEPTRGGGSLLNKVRMGFTTALHSA
jgi:hypothetical protein